MSYSLNEIEALSKRAARGATCDWGIAEEAAKATRWLCGQGLDGCLALSETLKVPRSDLQAPVTLKGALNSAHKREWAAETGALCPLLTGASLLDCADDISTQGLCLQRVHCPVMVLPFVAWAARATRTCLEITWQGACFVTDGQVVTYRHGAVSAPYAKTAPQVTIAQGNLLADHTPPTPRATPDRAVWTHLTSLAALTYAPATDLSRRLGAGAETSDND